MFSKTLLKIVGMFLVLSVQLSYSAEITVSQDGSGTYSSIQAAVNAAKPGDVIKITDLSVYKEQVTIKTSGITLTSSSPQSLKKPVIQWKDTVNVGPRNATEAKDGSKIVFDQNGALRVMRASDVTIDGVTVDGGGAYPWGFAAVWNAKDPLFHGNAAITLWIAGDVTIRNCELRNAYFGINVKDRNEGGIFANANPADIQPWLVVPLSGFGKTGNHLVENNRIHNNSWAMFFESTWDLGSVIRYNLIYENHHTPALAPIVKALPDGSHQPGGAILFKDHLLSPVAIYNNTFWHNYLIFAGGWRPGAQHLIFNNIYGEPYSHWATDKVFPNPYHALDPKFINRMHNCLYAAQSDTVQYRTQEYQDGAQDPGTNKYVEVRVPLTAPGQVRIMNGMDQVEVLGQDVVITIPLSTGDKISTKRAEWAIQPGALITSTTAGKPFPKDADVRWLEVKFKSTLETDPMFLTPDWDDPLMKMFIVDKGWPDAGIYDTDGSIADIGAIPFAGKRSESVAVIKPTSPVIIEGTSAIASFMLDIKSGEFNDPKIKYVKWVNNVTFDGDNFGGTVKTPIPLSELLPVTVTPQTFKTGNNSISFSVPTRTDAQRYAFLEIVLEGTDANNNKVTSSVGFLPYRKLEYKFVVEVWNMALTQKLTEVTAGQQVKLKISAMKIGDKTPMTIDIDTAAASLISGYNLLDDKGAVFTIPPKFPGTYTGTAVFTKVPPNKNLEVVSVSGKFVNPGQDIQMAINGSSEGIRVLPGEPVAIMFDKPTSDKRNFDPTVIDRGPLFPVSVLVYDKYENKVGPDVPVTIKSLDSLIGNVSGPRSAVTNDTGAALFNAVVTGGDKDEIFRLEATLGVNNAKDTASLIVGQARDKLWIFYNDLLQLDTSAQLRGNVGNRYPITIVSSTDGVVVTELDATIEVTPAPGTPLKFYASDTSRLPTNTFELVDGRVTVYVGASTKVDNGQIEASTPDNSIPRTSRAKIYFSQIPLYIFYDDYLKYDPAAKLEGIVGTRIKFTIAASVDGKTVSTSNVNQIEVKPSQNIPLKFYSSETDENADSVFTLADGKVDVWVTAFANITNGSIEARSLDTILQPVSRNNVYFSLMPLWVFYDDFGAFNPDAELRGYVGKRYPITIAASLDGKTVSEVHTNQIEISGKVDGTNAPLVFYASEDATEDTLIYTLDKGKVTVWVSSTAPVSNGEIQVAAVDNMLAQKSRNKVYFDPIPLIILYDDTLKYNPDSEIRGVAGSRYPVTIIATTDSSTPIESYQSELTLKPNSALKIFGSADINDIIEIANVSLKNGKTVVWVTSYTSVNNIEISVQSATDLSLKSTTRENIYFTKSIFTIEKAVVKAQNGFGRLDRIDLYYTTDLKNAPDSVEMNWPSNSPANRKFIRGENVTLDPGNARHVIVNLPDPFPEGLTTYSESNRLGIAYWSDPALPGTDPDRCQFSVSDSIGPLLTSAVLLQKFKPGNDTMYLTFSEDIPDNVLDGSSLVLKDEQGSISIKILSALNLNDTITAVVERSDAYTINEGDSLRINPEGDVVDLIAGNKPHPDNRPVVIQLRKIPPEIDSAFYADSDANGIVDKALVSFSIAVDISKISMAFVYDGTSVSNISADNLQYFDNDSSRVLVNLDGAFSAIKTSGSMIVTVNYEDFAGVQKRLSVDDRAAPVIRSASYHPGSALSQTLAADDTLRVNFSENVSIKDAISPFSFVQHMDGNTIVYAMNLEIKNQSGEFAEFLVKSVDDQIRPTSKDSIWIATNAIKVEDGEGNGQTNAENRRVNLKVNPVPISLTLKVGPNPFTIETGTTVRIVPQIKFPDLVHIKAQMVIYDQLGNKVYSFNEKTNPHNSPEIEFKWNGMNMNNRKVGAGTYLGLVTTTNLDTGKKTILKTNIGMKSN